MSTLLPPSVLGPVTVLSTDIRVDGPLPGSTVELLVNGIAMPAITAGTTSTYFAIPIGTLKVGDELTARWSQGGETSNPTPVATVVIGLPPKLSPLVYLSQIHTCVDWIIVGGVYPGATVDILNGAAVIGTATTELDSVSVAITGTINGNDVLQATQSIRTPTGTVRSPPTPSLPAEPTPYRENNMPAPSIGPVPGCSWSVPVLGIVQGATTHLNYNGDIVRYPYIGPSFWANIGREAKPPDTFTAALGFDRCHASSPFSSPPAGVDNSIPIRKPSIGTNQINCAAADALSIGNLDPGSTLTIQLVQPTGETSVVGKIGVGQGVSKAQFWIPDLSPSIPAEPPYPSLVAVQERCGQSSTSDKAIVWGKYQGSIFPPTILLPLVECAGGVLVNNVDGAVVRLYSDAPDSPILSGPVYNSYGDAVWVPTYRPLRAGENIHAQLELTCQPLNLRVGPAVQVSDLPELRAPKIHEPIRVFNRSVWISDVTVGANVHVFVNGKWRAQMLVNTYGGSITVDVGTLHVEDKITAVQTLCTKISPVTTPAINVTPGKLRLSAAPPTLDQGKAASLEITALDGDNGVKVAADVSIGGSVVGQSNTPFTLNAPVGQASINIAVSKSGYNTETITIPLTAAPVAPTAMLTINVGLGFNASKKVITSTTWNLLGPSSAFKKTSTPNSEPAAIQFALPPPPGGGFTPFTISCTVEFQYENFNFISGASGTGSSGYIQGGLIKPSPSTVEMHWSGTDLAINFSVEWIADMDTFVVQLV